MNSLQKTIRYFGLITLLVVALAPPWKLTVQKAGAAQVTAAGHHPIWNPPNAEVELDEEDADAANAHYGIDLVRLGVQLAIVLFVINIGVYLLKPKSQPAALAE